jgi:hypothetical protein
MKRTGIDFSKHELHLFISKERDERIYNFQIPNRQCCRLVFINSCGIMAVTGDFGNWIFCREFIPTKGGRVSDGYWCEKLQIASTQDSDEFDSDATQKEIEEYLANPEDPVTEDEKEYLEELLSLLNDEFDYMHYAHREGKGRFSDHERVPTCKRIKPWLLMVFDGFEEICSRVDENGIPLEIK